MNLYDTSDANGGIESTVALVRIRRGARAIGSDGDLGSVQQIVVDQDTGELRGIVVQRTRDGAEFEIPVDAVTRATGREVQFSLAQTDLDRRPDVARPYNPDHYVAVQPGNTAPRIQAANTARDTSHPVVTSVGQDAADLVAPPPTGTHTDTAISRVAPSTPRMNPKSRATDLAIPSSSANNTNGVNVEDTQESDTLPRHDAARADIGEETTMPSPPREASATPSVTGDLIGGKPSTGGMGESSTVPSSTIPAADTAATEDAAAASNPAEQEDDLSDLTDDELSNPDTALDNAQPDTVSRVARPFNSALPSTAATTNRPVTTDEERAGMRSAFRTATNTSADDTYTDRAPSSPTEDVLAAPEPADSAIPEPDSDRADEQPNAADLALPTTDALTLAESESTLDAFEVHSDLTLANSSTSTTTMPAPARSLNATTLSIAITAAIVAGDITLRLLHARRLRAFGRGTLVGAALALVLAPMPGSRLRAEMIEAAERLCLRAA
jgi:hypothetical protein